MAGIPQSWHRECSQMMSAFEDKADMPRGRNRFGLTQMTPSEHRADRAAGNFQPTGGEAAFFIKCRERDLAAVRWLVGVEQGTRPG
jgi:hypothetical protein